MTEQKADPAYLTSDRLHHGEYEVHPDQKRHSLVARLRAGDRAAATELVDGYYQQIYLFMRRLGHDRQISEDLTQESFFNAWHHIAQLRDGKALDSWLYRIAANVSLNRAKAEGRRKDSLSLDALLESGRISADRLFGSEPPTNAAERAQLQEAIQAALDSLDPDQRAVVVMKDVEDMSQDQIAEALDCSPGTVKSRLSRARARLRDLLRPVYAEWAGKEAP